MGDNEIIKALECCTSSCREIKCNSCPAFVGCRCTLKSKMLLDLINRQKAEIERLQSMNQAKLDMIHDIRAEIERLKGVIVPPVKVGDPIWRIYTWNGEHIVEGKISMIKQKADFTWKFRGIGKGFEGSKDFDVKDIGTLIFLSREEAEKTLKEMTEGGNV